MRILASKLCDEPKNSGGPSAYEIVAEEYYDATLHPTCANFRELSANVLRDYFRVPATKGTGMLCEVGAGDSLVAETLDKLETASDSLIVTDLSVQMLAHSRKYTENGVRLAVAAASHLPFSNESVELIVSVLGDPYNTDDFWAEVRRVLTPEGRCLFITPSFEWANSFRLRTTNEKENKALFILRTGEKAFLPSFILDETNQRSMINRAKLNTLAAFSVSAANIRLPISPKLRADKPGQYINPIVTYVVSR